jgi:hippurate hydrolase
MSWRFVGAFMVLIGLVEASVAADAQEPTRRVAPSSNVEERVDAWIDAHLDALIGVYRHLHAHPELSLEEKETAALVVQELREAGYVVESGIGGHGVVGVLRNGAGPVLLVRGDMDALPVTEATGLAWASRVEVVGEEGVMVGTMHACGHDLHVTNLIGTARLFAEIREAWRGTLVILAQPAEEIGRGARMMIEDGLFERIPMPDHALALHVNGELPAGTIGYVSGWAAANVDSVAITLHGRGGHGARPHQTIDPIVTAAHLVTALQTLVSRRVDPTEPAVVTVGSIHGGTKNNVIPDDVRLELTVRSYTDEVRHQLLEGIQDLARDVCQAFDCPRPPDVSIRADGTPAMYNDPALVAAGVEVFRAFLGEEQVVPIAATMTGEDFGRYSRHAEFPAFLFRIGSVEPKRWRQSREGGEPLPSLHSSRYAPDVEPTLRVGLGATARLALTLLGEP